MTRKSFNSRAAAASVVREMAYAREEFARRLLAAREAAHLSQEDAANRAGMSPRQWVRLENAKAMPYHSTLEKISRALKVDINDLTGEEGPAPLGLNGVPPDLEDRLQALEHNQVAILARLDEILEIARRRDNARRRTTKTNAPDPSVNETTEMVAAAEQLEKTNQPTKQRRRAKR